MAVASAIGRSDSAVKPQNMAVAPAIERMTWLPSALVRNTSTTAEVVAPADPDEHRDQREEAAEERSVRQPDSGR